VFKKVGGTISVIVAFIPADDHGFPRPPTRSPSGRLRLSNPDDRNESRSPCATTTGSMSGFVQPRRF
jgi:hypothetical protein